MTNMYVKNTAMPFSVQPFKDLEQDKKTKQTSEEKDQLIGHLLSKKDILAPSNEHHALLGKTQRTISNANKTDKPFHNKTKVTTNTIDALFSTFGESVVSLEEQSLFADFFENNKKDWSPSIQHHWKQKMEEVTALPERFVRTNTGAAEAEDLSSSLQTFWFESYQQPEQKIIIADMLKVCQETGSTMVLQLEKHFLIQEVMEDLCERTGMTPQELDKHLDLVYADKSMKVSEWSEDNKIISDGDGDNLVVKTPATVDIDTVKDARDMLRRMGLYKTGTMFQGKLVQDKGQQSAANMANKTGTKHEEMTTYLEGGNVLMGTKSDGRPYAIVGDHSLTISTIHLCKQGQFSTQDVQTKVQEMENNSAFVPKLLEAASKQIDRSIDTNDDGEVVLYGEKLAMESLPDMESPEVQQLAKEFLAKQELTKRYVADDLGVSLEDLVFIEQTDFHIDMSMRPLNHGQVLFHHPKESVALLEAFLAEPNLDEDEKKTLERMLKNANKELSELGPRYDHVEKTLQNAGIKTERMAGIFSAGRKKRTNFMNAVPGLDANNETRYLVLGSSVNKLEQHFESKLKELGVDHVHFIGNNNAHRSQSAAELSLQSGGGLDCREAGHGRQHQITDLLHGLLHGTYTEKSIEQRDKEADDQMVKALLGMIKS